MTRIRRQSQAQTWERAGGAGLKDSPELSSKGKEQGSDTDSEEKQQERLPFLFIAFQVL